MLFFRTVPCTVSSPFWPVLRRRPLCWVFLPRSGPALPLTWWLTTGLMGHHINAQMPAFRWNLRHESVRNTACRSGVSPLPGGASFWSFPCCWASLSASLGNGSLLCPAAYLLPLLFSKSGPEVAACRSRLCSLRIPQSFAEKRAAPLAPGLSRRCSEIWATEGTASPGVG